MLELRIGRHSKHFQDVPLVPAAAVLGLPSNSLSHLGGETTMARHWHYAHRQPVPDFRRALAPCEGLLPGTKAVLAPLPATL